jgi:hypothetical protein
MPQMAHFSCAEKSSLVSSSSQLSSHRCVLSPGTSVSSCVQSARIVSFCFAVYLVFSDVKRLDSDSRRKRTFYREILKLVILLQSSCRLCILRLGAFVCGGSFGCLWRGARSWCGRHCEKRRGSRGCSCKESDATIKTESLAWVKQKQEVAGVGFEGVLKSLGALAETNILGLALVLLGGDPKIRSVRLTFLPPYKWPTVWGVSKPTVLN